MNSSKSAPAHIASLQSFHTTVKTGIRTTLVLRPTVTNGSPHCTVSGGFPVPVKSAESLAPGKVVATKGGKDGNIQNVGTSFQISCAPYPDSFADFLGIE